MRRVWHTEKGAEQKNIRRSPEAGSDPLRQRTNYLLQQSLTLVS